MRKLFGAILLSMALGVLPWGMEKAFAAAFTIPHTFQAGGVVSSDELNERFDNLEQQQRDFVPADLVGTWNCPVTLPTTSPSSSVIPGAANYSYTGWTISGDSLTMTPQVLPSLTFTISSGTLYLSSSECAPAGAFQWGICGVSNAAVQIIRGTTLSPCGSIRKVSNTRFECSAITTLGGAWATCDKQNIPPLKPSGLTANAVGTSITLTWTDNSADETYFDILRKDTVTGTYAVVGTVNANTITYVNTPVTSGTHWYRVVARNANGSSLGSNVAKVSN